MSELQDQQETARVEQVSNELTRALKLCHSLINDYRSKLTVELKDMGDFQPANDDHHSIDETRLG
jgi:hypothetical protein